MSFGDLTDKILRKEKVGKALISFTTGILNHRCTDYDYEGKCNQKMKVCHYAYTIDKYNEVKCRNYHKKDKGNSDNNINSDIFNRPAYR